MSLTEETELRKQIRALDARALNAEAKLENARQYLAEIRTAIDTALAMRYPNELPVEDQSEEYLLLHHLRKLAR